MLTWMEKWKVGFGMMGEQGEQGFELVHHNLTITKILQLNVVNYCPHASVKHASGYLDRGRKNSPTQCCQLLNVQVCSYTVMQVD